MNKQIFSLLGLSVAISLVVDFQVDAEESVEGRYLANVRQVSQGFEKAGEGYFSPDGQQIVFQATKDGYPFYQIYVQSLEGSDATEPRRISTGRGRTTCAYFHPTEAKVLFASSHLDPKLDETEAEERARIEADRKSGKRRRYQWDFDPYMDLFEASLETGKIERQLTDARGYDAEGAYSTDGKRIAFCSSRDGDPDIYVMNSDGTDVKQVTNAPGYDGGPFISPDGQWIVFRSDRKKAEYLQIHVVGIDGQQDQALTETDGVNWGPFWHPKEPYLIWSGADHSNPNSRPNYDLWLMSYEIQDGKFRGAKPIRITDFEGADVLPVFSPDGERLMWTSTRAEDHSSQLFVADFQLPKGK